jgi:hypothetical protein
MLGGRLGWAAIGPLSATAAVLYAAVVLTGKLAVAAAKFAGFSVVEYCSGCGPRGLHLSL